MLTRKAMLRSQPACTYALLIDSHKKPKIWTEMPHLPIPQNGEPSWLSQFAQQEENEKEG